MTKRRGFLQSLASVAAAEPLGALACGTFATGAFAAGITPAEAAAPAAAPAPSASVDLARFIALSTLLTGYTSLDGPTGAVYLRSIRANSAQSAALDETYARSGIAGATPPNTLAALTATGIFATPATLAATSTILAAWFSGTFAAANGTTTETWDDAFAWKACTFTKPPATCGGATGYWSKAPA
jgi:Membrane bound FAD containing D-sorbitol dehydrogenase